MYSEAINEFEIFSKDKMVDKIIDESRITLFKNIVSHRGVEK